VKLHIWQAIFLISESGVARCAHINKKPAVRMQINLAPSCQHLLSSSRAAYAFILNFLLGALARSLARAMGKSNFLLWSRQVFMHKNHKQAGSYRKRLNPRQKAVRVCKAAIFSSHPLRREMYLCTDQTKSEHRVYVLCASQGQKRSYFCLMTRMQIHGAAEDSSHFTLRH